MFSLESMSVNSRFFDKNIEYVIVEDCRQNAAINVDLDEYSFRNDDGVNLSRRILDWIE